jgi:hypothetical protein
VRQSPALEMWPGRDLTRLIAARCQAEMSANLWGAAEPHRVVDRRNEGDGCNRTDARHRDEARHDIMVPRDREQLTVVALNSSHDRMTRLEE